MSSITIAVKRIRELVGMNPALAKYDVVNGDPEEVIMEKLAICEANASQPDLQNAAEESAGPQSDSEVAGIRLATEAQLRNQFRGLRLDGTPWE